MSKKNEIRTSKKVAKVASAVLRSKKTSRKLKSLGGSSLSNRRKSTK